MEIKIDKLRGAIAYALCARSIGDTAGAAADAILALPEMREALQRAEAAEAECARLTREVKRIRGEASDHIDHLNTQHDETRGYRQHAEAALTEERAECARLRAKLDEAEARIGILERLTA